MAKKTVRIGSFGPFIYDDNNQPAAVNTDGDIQANNLVTEGLTANLRLVASDTNKKLAEVNDLTNWLAGGHHITVTDDGDGSVTIETKNLFSLTNITSGDSPFNISVTADKDIVIIDASGGAVTVNLPPAANWTGKTVVIKKTDATNNITVQADGTETIDGSNTYTLTTQYNAVTLVSDGTDIWIISTQ